MRVITNSDASSGGGPHAVTIGVYDGVHLGHQAVLAALARLGDELGAETAVVTFDPHPAQVVRPESAPKLLTGLDQRLELLDQNGVDTAVVVEFDADRAAESAQSFVDRVLVAGLHARAVVVGEDFHFGRGRSGDTELLGKLGAERGFVVHPLELLVEPTAGDRPISSTLIRRDVAQGQVAEAALMLGRCHEIRGVVVEGDKRGRTIGFPTANVAVPTERAVPGDGVYAAWYIDPDGARFPAAVNVGKRPTFYQNAERSLVEAHLLDFDGDLYGQDARVQFVDRLRSEQRFDGLEGLKAQLDLDIAGARLALG